MIGGRCHCLGVVCSLIPVRYARTYRTPTRVLTWSFNHCLASNARLEPSLSLPLLLPGYTIHGTHGLLVQGNTGFHIQGHCFYLEDGVEERNRLDGNFAGFVHPLGRDDTCTEIGSVFGADPVYQARSLMLSCTHTAVACFAHLAFGVCRWSVPLISTLLLMLLLSVLTP